MLSNTFCLRTMTRSLALVLLFLSYVWGIRESRNASIEDYPYTLSLRFLGKHICGAALISENTAITTARCILGVPSNYLSIYAGSTFRETGGYAVDVVDQLLHPDFNSTTRENDIAILYLMENLPVGIPGLDFAEIARNFNISEAVGRTLTVTGWGAVGPRQHLADHLQTKDEKVLSLNLCRIVVPYPSVFCLGYVEQMTCLGDYGDPAVIDGQLVGIATENPRQANNCNSPGMASFFIDVTRYVEWIEENTAKM